MKKIVITGGNGAIAQGIKQLLLSKEGFEILTPGSLELDVTNISLIQKYMSKNRPDVLINNAGYIVPQSITDGNIYEDQKSININLQGVFSCTNVALRYNPSCQIINIGAAAAVEAHGDWSAYCASKAGVAMATKCWAEDGLYSVCISPGRTASKMRENLFPGEDQETLLMPNELAKVVFLAIEKKIESGSHLIVKKNNVNMILKGVI
jgi:NAD(P)-dependent dehydrogenase (short-subunit alcohol dehydrogenase family)